MNKNIPTRTLSEKDVKIILKNEKPGGFYFVFGNENFLKLHYAEAIAKKAVGKDFEDFNMHRFDGKHTSVEMLKNAVEALPMLSEYSCVLVYDFPIYDLSQQDAENLKAMLDDVPQSCCLIFLMATIVRKSRKAKKDTEKSESEGNENDNADSDLDEEILIDSVKTNIWDDILAIAQNNGFAIELNKRGFNELTTLIIKGATDRGKTIDERTARYFVENVGNDIANLRNELDKICAFISEKNVTEKDIDLIATKTIEARIFDMAKYLTTKNSDEAFGILDTLISQKVEPILIMGTLISPFVDMYRVKAAIRAGHRPEDAAKYFNYVKMEFRLTKQAKLVTKFSMNQLNACLDFLNDADTAIKSRSIEPRLIIEQAMTKIANVISV